MGGSREIVVPSTLGCVNFYDYTRQSCAAIVLHFMISSFDTDFILFQVWQEGSRRQYSWKPNTCVPYYFDWVENKEKEVDAVLKF